MLKSEHVGESQWSRRAVCFSVFVFGDGLTGISLLSCMRTGTGGSQTATFCQAKTAWWWCGTMAAAGATCPATITWLTPARKAPVSSRVCFRASRFPLSRGLWIFRSLVRTATQSPKRQDFWESSAELRDGCSRAFRLCSGLPAEAESSDQMPVQGPMGEATDLVHPWWVQGPSASGGPEPPWSPRN